ncbi:MAG: polysaccharide pyruvyl transferase family protein [Thermincola sp.]|nr:polysaccharide pyruvyl transferase family protein [Thermincola sp.]MDT3703379.1 polysaccharide pyruvyl transferase family protein [Thermincola sp.]
MITLYCIRPKGFNVGNDAIFIAMQHFIYKAFGEIVNLVSVPATSRYESQAKAGLTPQTIHEINQFGHGVIIGGGNLYENGELEVNLDALGTLDVPLFLFSISSGRIYNRRCELVKRTDAMPDRIIRALDHTASFSLARDRETFNHLKNIGCEKVQIGGCPTLFLNRVQGRLPNLYESDRHLVLISVRNPSLMNIPLNQQANVYTDILNMIAFLKGEGMDNIKLLCHDHRDIPFAASFKGMEYIYTGDVYTYLALLQSCRLNITYRLHSCLPCLSFGTPVIKISYDERAISLMNTIGFGDWNINMVTSDNLINDIIDRYKRIDELSGVVSSCRMTWNGLYDIMADHFGAFANKVTDYYKTSN